MGVDGWRLPRQRSGVVLGTRRHHDPRLLGLLRDVEVGLDVLRMPRVAVPALTIVLPDELPVGPHVVLALLGDPRQRESLRRQRRFELGCGVID